MTGTVGAGCDDSGAPSPQVLVRAAFHGYGSLAPGKLRVRGGATGRDPVGPPLVPVSSAPVGDRQACGRTLRDPALTGS